MINTDHQAAKLCFWRRILPIRRNKMKSLNVHRTTCMPPLNIP